jgi:hypothetical protein
VNVKYLDESSKGMAVPPDEEFYSKYFSLQSVKTRSKKRKSDGLQADESAEVSDFEEEVDRVLQGTDESEDDLEYSEDGEALDEEDSVLSGSLPLSDAAESADELHDSATDAVRVEGEIPLKESNANEMAHSMKQQEKLKKKTPRNTESWVKRAKKMGIDTSSVLMDADSFSELIDIN